MTEDQVIAGIIEREGRRFTNDPADAGGPTRYGITAATLGDWRRLGRPATAAEVAALAEAEAREIYWHRYITGPGFTAIRDDALRIMMIDAGVHHGPIRSTRWVQEILGVLADGHFGPITAAAMNALGAVAALRLEKRLVAHRLRHFAKQMNDHSQWPYAGGYMNRAAAMLEL